MTAYHLKFISTEKHLETSSVFPNLAFFFARKRRPSACCWRRKARLLQPCRKAPAPDSIFSEEKPSFSHPSPTHQTPSHRQDQASPGAQAPSRAETGPWAAQGGAVNLCSLAPARQHVQCMKWCLTGLLVATYSGCLLFLKKNMLFDLPSHARW